MAVVKNKTVLGGKEFWDHVERIAAWVDTDPQFKYHRDTVKKLERELEDEAQGQNKFVPYQFGVEDSVLAVSSDVSESSKPTDSF